MGLITKRTLTDLSAKSDLPSPESADRSEQLLGTASRQDAVDLSTLGGVAVKGLF
jgi:hypothetical protein